MIATLRRVLNERATELGLPDGLVVRVRAPWRHSRLGRCSYTVHAANAGDCLLILQDSVSLAGVPCRSNPYEPSFSADVQELLAPRRGVLSVDGQTFYWSEWLTAPSLRGADDARRFAARIGALQRSAVRRSVDPASRLVDLCREKIADAALEAFFLEACAPLLAHSPRSLPCAWSHGDLWPRDVLVDGDGFRVLDWEWALADAPVGVDLVDLCVTWAEHVLGTSTEDAWARFARGDAAVAPLRRELTSLWDTVDYAADERQFAVAYARARSIARVVAQDGVRAVPAVEATLGAA